MDQSDTKLLLRVRYHHNARALCMSKDVVRTIHPVKPPASTL